jgi:hypothetical protein
MPLIQKEERIFAYVLSDGKIHVTVPEGTEGAKIRTYKTSDGVEGEKTELVYNELIGKITNVNFRDGNYSTQLLVTVADGDEKPIVLSLGTSSNYGEDLMKKLLNIDLTKKVKIVPYSFMDDKNKNKRGITVWQHNGKENVKLGNYFYDADKKKLLHGFPDVPAAIKKLQDEDKKVPTTKWKAYFGGVQEFLIEQTKERFNITDVPKEDNSDSELEEMVEEASKQLE